MAHKRIFAVSEKDFERFGCSSCGCKDGHDSTTSNLARLRRCQSCNSETIILTDGVKTSPISVQGGEYFPALSRHPLDIAE